MELLLSYTNSAGKTVDFTVQEGQWASAVAFLDYEHSYSIVRNKVRYFEREDREREIPIMIFRASDAEGLRSRDEIYRIFDWDVRNNTPGKFRLNGWYCEGFVIASESRMAQYTGAYMEATVTVLLPNPVWIKEEKHQFLPMTDTEPDGLDFPFDFPCDLGAPPPSRALSTGAEFPSDFKIVIYGGEAGVSNPSVRIGRNLYQVYVDVPPNGYLIIDSHKKAEIGESIQLIDNTGMVFNAMGLRNKGIPKSGEYIFEKIPSGQHLITTNGNFGFDITLYLERSAPPWTSS